MAQSGSLTEKSSTEKGACTPTNKSTSTSYISPLTNSQLRRSCLEDLKKIKELHEEGILTEEEFFEQKSNILNSLKTFQ